MSARRFKGLMIIIAMFWLLTVAVTPAFADAYKLYQKARFYYKNGLFTASKICYEKILQNFPDDAYVPLAILGVGACAYEMNDLESAEYYLARIWQEDQTPYYNQYIDTMYFYLINTKIALGLPADADQLSQAYSIHYWYKDMYAEVLYRVAEAYFQASENERALKVLKKLDKLEMGQPYDVYSQYLRGMIALTMDDQAGAEMYFRNILEMAVGIHLMPDDVQMMKDQARLKLADLYFQQERYASSYMVYDTIQNLNLLGDKRLLGMAWCEFMLGEEQAALSILEDLIIDYPKSIYRGEANFLQGVSFLHIKDPLFAVLYFEYFLELIKQYEAMQTDKPLEIQIIEEKQKVNQMMLTINELEANLTLLDENDANKLMAKILDEKYKINLIQQGVDRLYDRSVQRKIEMQLKVEAEYGLSKAKLLLSRPGE